MRQFGTAFRLIHNDENAPTITACAFQALYSITGNSWPLWLKHLKGDDVCPLLVFTDDLEFANEASGEDENFVQKYFISDSAEKQGQVTQPDVIVLKGGMPDLPAQIVTAFLERFANPPAESETELTEPERTGQPS